MRSLFIPVLLILTLATESISAQTHRKFESSEAYKKLTEYIDTTFIIPLINIHDPAFEMPGWEFTLIDIPEKKSGYFLFELREKKNMFIVAKFDFRVYLSKGRISVQNLKKSEFISLKKWLEEYKTYYNTVGKTKRGC